MEKRMVQLDLSLGLSFIDMQKKNWKRKKKGRAPSLSLVQQNEMEKETYVGLSKCKWGVRPTSSKI